MWSVAESACPSRSWLTTTNVYDGELAMFDLSQIIRVLAVSRVPHDWLIVGVERIPEVVFR
jgi:hypothetical protein